MSFTIAGLTGAGLRFGLLYGFPWALNYADVRHAHSHLMFFAWVTPAAMLLAGQALADRRRRLPGGATVAIAAAVMGLAAYLPFLTSGYRLTPLGDSELPLSMMASGLNGVVWYAFAALWWFASRRLRRDAVLRYFDGAVFLLVAASLGAVGLAWMGMSGAENAALQASFVDFFLTLFADGWFGVAIVAGALVATRRGAATVPVATWPAAALVTGLLLRSGSRLLADGLGWQWTAPFEAVGGVIAALAWLVAVVHVWPRRAGEGPTLLHVALALLATKALAELAMATPAGAAWVTANGLRVFLLHAFLLGAISIGLVSAFRARYGADAFRGATAFALAVGLMLVSLLPLTGLWPPAYAGRWALTFAAVAALGPPLAAAVAAASAVSARSARSAVSAGAPADEAAADEAASRR
ncbi:MAG: hypothetical protein R6W77_10130 [Trueperaceae bacterium]